MANPLAQREWQMRRCQVGVDCQFIFVVSLSSGPLSVLWCPCPLLLSSSVVSLSSLVLSCPLLSSSVVSLSSPLVLFCGVLVLSCPLLPLMQMIRHGDRVDCMHLVYLLFLC